MDRPNYIKRHIDLATKIARTGQHDQYFLGAVLVKKGQVISCGANNPKTHPAMGFKTIHAELQCILGVRWSDLSKSVLFVSRVTSGGKTGLSKPCSLCQSLLKRYGISKVYFTTSTGVGELRLS